MEIIFSYLQSSCAVYNKSLIQVPKVEELDSSEVDNSVLSNLSEGSKSWAVIHATDDTDLKDEVKGEIQRQVKDAELWDKTMHDKLILTPKL